MGPGRRRGGSPTHLEWRIRIFGVGAILGVLGIFYEARWMIWLAIAVLLGGFLLRFLPGEAPAVEEDDEADGLSRD